MIPPQVAPPQSPTSLSPEIRDQASRAVEALDNKKDPNLFAIASTSLKDDKVEIVSSYKAAGIVFSNNPKKKSLFQAEYARQAKDMGITIEDDKIDAIIEDQIKQSLERNGIDAFLANRKDAAAIKDNLTRDLKNANVDLITGVMATNSLKDGVSEEAKKILKEALADKYSIDISTIAAKYENQSRSADIDIRHDKDAEKKIEVPPIPNQGGGRKR